MVSLKKKELNKSHFNKYFKSILESFDETKLDNYINVLKISGSCGICHTKENVYKLSCSGRERNHCICGSCIKEMVQCQNLKCPS